MLLNRLNWAFCHSAHEATPDLELQDLLTGYALSTCEVIIQVEKEQRMVTVSASGQQANKLPC